MKLKIIGLLILLASQNLKGQIVDNIISSFDGEKITVVYNLENKNANQRFNILAYSSHNNYSEPLVVDGDVGENVVPGKGKRIIWEAKRYLLSAFNADVQIKIKATPQFEVPVLAFQPLAVKSFKRGRSMHIKWGGANPADKLTLELYKDNSPILVIEKAVSNLGSYEWKIPQNLKGKDYSFRLVGEINPAQHAISDKFKIVPRTPLAAKIAPIAVVSVGAAFLILNGDVGD